mgnify:CR=1 FL=1
MKTFTIILFIASATISLLGVVLFLRGFVAGEIEYIRKGVYTTVPSATVFIYVWKITEYIDK